MPLKVKPFIPFMSACYGKCVIMFFFANGKHDSKTETPSTGGQRDNRIREELY